MTNQARTWDDAITGNHEGSVDMNNAVTMTLVGGPTVVLSYAGRTVVTDPTFDAPGTIGGLTKTLGPAVSAASIGPVDLALISHDHHADNLDVSGYALARGAKAALTTVAGARRKPELWGLEEGETFVIEGSPSLRVTAVPAQHGPRGVAKATGPVIGFVMRARGWPTVYFSGDNASVAVAQKIAEQHRDVALVVICAGAARVPHRGPVMLTADAARTARIAALWPAATVVPVHWDSWAHFSEPRETALSVLSSRGLGERLVVLEPGVATTVSAPASSPEPEA